MKTYINDIVEKKTNGLALIQLPTGYGKTFQISEIAKDYVLSQAGNRKIIYLTTLNKNLPEDTLCKLFGDDILYSKKVLRIPANLDSVKENIETTDIPERYRSEKYEKLLSSVKKLKAKENVSDKEYVEQLIKKASNDERAFRREIYYILKAGFANKKDRLYAIHNDNNYKWIGKLYPAVFTDEHDILMMSVNKFLHKNNTIIEPSYDFINAPFLDNAIVILDEFDAIKKVILDEIIKRALSIENEYLKLFRFISRNMRLEDMSEQLTVACNNVVGKYTASSLKEESDEIYSKYHVNLSYKTIPDGVDRTQNFLVKDGTYHTILQKGKKYIRIAHDDKKNRMSIFFETAEEYHNNKSGEINLFAMLRDIGNYLFHFRCFIHSWAKEYTKLENAERIHRGKNGAVVDLMTEENALSTIIDNIGLSEKHKYFLIGELCDAIVHTNSDENLPDTSFYQKGMEVFEFVDKDTHNEFTALNFVQIFDTPEKILLYLANKALLIGVSATALIPTVVGNFDLEYLKEKLGDNYIPMSKMLSDKIGQELEENWKAYSDGRIKITADIIWNTNGYFDLEELCKEIFSDEDLAVACSNLIKNKASNEYYQKRYFNILKNMYWFMKNDSIQSMLCLGMALPKTNNPDMDSELIDYLAENILADVGISMKERLVYILKSDNFDEDKEQLIKRLETGTKTYIISSYMTIGAGQNLQYKIPKGTNCVCLKDEIKADDSRFFSKDIDGIYLCEVTNKSINTYGEGSISNKQLLDLLFQIQEVYIKGEISFQEKKIAIRNAFDAKRGARVANKLKDTRSVRMIATQQVLQAVGRMCRTFMKSPEIALFIDESLLDELDAKELNRRILPPEMKFLLELKNKLGKVYSGNENIALNIAERISTDGNWLIHQLLSRNWTDNSMKIWKDIRDIAMQYPTANEDIYATNEYIRKLYITAGADINEYLYYQRGDFNNVTIDFGVDAVAFKNSDRLKIDNDEDEGFIMKVSSEDSKLLSILKYPGMRQYFEQNNYACSFALNNYIMSPVVFHNIYKGALGEVAGKFILEHERGIGLKEIIDPDRFEFFDYEMTDGVYVDFKNWKFTYNQDRQTTLVEISKKLDAIGAKRVYIINVVGNVESVTTESIDARIIEIPALIDGEGNIIPGMLNKIKKEDYE